MHHEPSHRSDLLDALAARLPQYQHTPRDRTRAFDTASIRSSSERPGSFFAHPTRISRRRMHDLGITPPCFLNQMIPQLQVLCSHNFLSR